MGRELEIDYKYPEEHLVVAVLKQAFKDLNLSHNSRDFKTAAQWFSSNGSNNYIIPFEFACEVLNIDPGFLRKRKYDELAENRPGVNLDSYLRF